MDTTKIKLGVNYNPQTESVDFRLYSKNAVDISLEIFENPEDVEALAVFNLEKKEDDIWETSIKKYALFGLKKPFYYGYKIEGDGECFNSKILAYDPYSKALLYDNTKKDYEIKSVFFEYNPIDVVPISTRPFADEIIAEVHIKDLTANSGLPYAGTFKAASEMAKKLKEMKISMVEFLPLNDFDDLDNYWGYMPLSYFALHKKYSYSNTYQGAIEEFQEMINAFHREDIKVCMDVVYNHSAKNASFKLIDADSYYKINKDGYFMNNSGCGNDLKCANSAYAELVLDSVAYFAKLGVDAFRFDLGLALMDISESANATYNPDTSLFGKMPKLLQTRGVKVSDGFSEGINLITEPWTCGGKDCYALGKFPKFVYEWNDVARNLIRSSTLRPDNLKFKDYKNLIEGTKSVFKNEVRTINYIASHDGMTLYDLNSYYKEGWEICGNHFGDEYRKNNSIKKQISLLLLSYGTTMLSLGDLIMHSKGGNSNSYKEENEINYLDFSKLNKDEKVLEIYNYWQKMLDFRLKYRPQDAKRFYYKQNSEILYDEEETKDDYFAYLGECGLNKKFFVASNNTAVDMGIKLPALNSSSWQIYSRSSLGDEEFILKPFEIAIYIEK